MIVRSRVKALKGKTLPYDIKAHELDIHGLPEKYVNWVSNVRHVNWVVLITVGLTLLFTFMPYSIWAKFTGIIKSNGTLVLLLLLFCLVALSLVLAAGQALDVLVFKVFNVYGHRGIGLDWIMLSLTQLGSGTFAFILAFVFFMWVNQVLAYELVLGTLTLWLFVELLKILVQRTRPYIKLNKIRIVGSRARGYSFPSGHTSQSFFIATLVTHYFSFSVPVILAVYAGALTVGITRIYVGMHYPRDVMGGAILGTAWGFLGIMVTTAIFG